MNLNKSRADLRSMQVHSFGVQWSGVVALWGCGGLRRFLKFEASKAIRLSFPRKDLQVDSIHKLRSVWVWVRWKYEALSTSRMVERGSKWWPLSIEPWCSTLPKSHVFAHIEWYSLFLAREGSGSIGTPLRNCCLSHDDNTWKHHE